MTLEELQESANRDLKIDETDLGSESINQYFITNTYNTSTSFLYF